MEEKFFKSGYKKILAIDEVGRGAFAGPFYVIGVSLNRKIFNFLKNLPIKDSKKLQEKKREKIFKITKNIIKYEIIKFSNVEVDRFGIGKTFKIGILKLKNLLKPNIILVDGKYIRIKGIKRIKFIIDGDEKLISIGLASIIGKVLRDRYMKKISKFYPLYEFHKNKGYGTKKHIKIIKKYGICKYHRKSFLKNILKI